MYPYHYTQVLHTHIHIYTHRYTFTYMYAHIYTHIHMYTYIYIHTYLYSHKYIIIGCVCLKDVSPTNLFNLFDRMSTHLSF